MAPCLSAHQYLTICFASQRVAGVNGGWLETTGTPAGMILKTRKTIRHYHMSVSARPVLRRRRGCFRLFPTEQVSPTIHMFVSAHPCVSLSHTVPPPLRHDYTRPLSEKAADCLLAGARTGQEREGKQGEGGLPRSLTTLAVAVQKVHCNGYLQAPLILARRWCWF